MGRILKWSFICTADTTFFVQWDTWHNSNSLRELFWTEHSGATMQVIISFSTLSIWWRYRHRKCVTIMDMDLPTIKYLFSTCTVWDRKKVCQESYSPKHKIQWLSGIQWILASGPYGYSSASTASLSVTLLLCFILSNL